MGQRKMNELDDLSNKQKKHKKLEQSKSINDQMSDTCQKSNKADELL